MNRIQRLSRHIVRRVDPDLPEARNRRRSVRSRFRGAVSRVIDAASLTPTPRA